MKNAKTEKEDFQTQKRILKPFFKFSPRNRNGIGRWEEFVTIEFRRIRTAVSKYDEKYRLTETPLTFCRFRQICDAENIIVAKEKFTDTNLGLYRKDFETGKKTICLSSGLRGAKLLFVAAHELAHYFLHTEKMEQGFFRSADITFGEKYIAEYEADFLASIMIYGGAK